MLKTFLLAGSALLILSCNNGADTPEGESDSAAEEIVIEEEAPVVEPDAFPEVFSFLGRSDSSFTPARFVTGETTPIDSTAAAPLTPAFDPYLPYLIYNKDSSTALDLYSYNYLLMKKDSVVKAVQAGPDTEVALVDLRRKTRQRLLFFGPSMVIFDARWGGPDQWTVVGAEVISSGELRPMIWQLNMRSGEQQVLPYPDTVRAGAGEYRDARFR